MTEDAGGSRDTGGERCVTSGWSPSTNTARTVVRRGFLIITLAIPLGMAALIALAILVEAMGADNRPLGYVDHSGMLASRATCQPAR